MEETKLIMRKIFFFALSFLLLNTCFSQQKIWTVKQANEWYSKQGWLVGADFDQSIE